MPKQKKEKPKIKYSAGRCLGEDCFEQVKGNQFAYLANISEEIALIEYWLDGEWTIYPLPRVPWKLATIPIKYDDPQKLYDDINAYIKAHLFLPSEELYDVLTAWAMATWIPEVWTVVPYLFFYGALASGKTRGLEVLQRICYRGILSANFSTAALFRASELWRPTVFLDETEVYNKETRIEIIALLNSGYRKGQYVHRLRRTEQGHQLESFDVFGFKALAGTEGMRDTLESRSIPLRMIKALTPVRRKLDEATATDLRNRLLGFRFYEMALVNDVNDVNLFPEYKPLDFGDGRLEELFDCLLKVAPKGDGSIRKYAKEMSEIRGLEEKASVEADIIRVLVENKQEMEKGVILTRLVTSRFNEGRLEKERWKSSSVGRILRKLGFNKTHTRLGNGFQIPEARLNYLAKIYGVDITLGKGSQGSQGSQTIDKMLQPQPLKDKKPPNNMRNSEGAKKAAEMTKKLREMKKK